MEKESVEAILEDIEKLIIKLNYDVGDKASTNPNEENLALFVPV